MGIGEVGMIIESAERARELLGEAKRVAVVGIKPEPHAGAAAHYVPAFLQRQGVDVVPVPVYYPEVMEILGERVYRTVTEIPGEVDMVILFRRSKDVAQHVDDIIAKSPRVVWMQQGIRDAESAERLSAAGIDVVQDRCTMVDYPRTGVR
jgi:predicted CoA-binding protein